MAAAAAFPQGPHGDRSASSLVARFFAYWAGWSALHLLGSICLGLCLLPTPTTGCLNLLLSAMSGVAAALLNAFPQLHVALAVLINAAAYGLVFATAHFAMRSVADRRALRNAPCCQVCGYDLRGAPDDRSAVRCPECGNLEPRRA